MKRGKEALSHEDRHKDGMGAVDVSSDGEMIVSGGADSAVRLLFVDSKERRSP